ncbi:MAG: polysaccharide biosynthesis C-terminal domain-containing protein, partial [Desulfosporosinus sp.]
DNMIYNYFQARQEMYIAAVYQFLSTFFIGLGTILVLVKQLGVIQISLVQLVVIAVITLLLYRTVVKVNPLRVEWSAMGAMVRGGLPFGISYLFYYIYFQVATFMLSLMRTTAEVGTYSAAYRLMSVLLFIPGIVTSVLYPILYQLGVGDMEKHKQTVEKIFKFLTAIGLLISLLFFLLADPIIYFLYGAKFAGAGLALKLLAWFFLLEAMSFTIGDVLTTTNNQWTRTLIQGSAALGNVGLNYFMIRQWGIYGSSVATLITEVFVLIAYLFAVRKKVYDINIARQLPSVFIAGLGLCAVALLLPNVNFFVSAFLAGVVYLILLDRLDKDVHKVVRYILSRLRSGKFS